MDAELVFIEDLAKGMQTGRSPKEGLGIDRYRIDGLFQRYQPDHLTGPEQLDVLRGFQDILGREISRLEACENRFSDLIARIGQAETIQEVRNLHCDLTALTIRVFQETGSVRNLQEKCTRFRQEITCRLISFVEKQMLEEGYGPPPSAYVWISMGADGRGEQTILTDQDSLLVYQDIPRSRQRFEAEVHKKLIRRDIRESPLEESQVDLVDSYFEIFSRKMVNCLDHVGIKKCVGGVIPTNGRWRDSLKDWIDRLKQKIKYGSGTITILDLIILMDARSVAGDRALGGQFVGRFRDLIEKTPSIQAEVAKSAVLMPVALGFLRRFRTERSGHRRGKFNLKLKGWAPLVLTLRALAMKYGIKGTNSFDRIRSLEVLGLISPTIASDLEKAYRLLLSIHIRKQIESIKLRKRFDNFFDPATLSEDEQTQLKNSLLRIEVLQKLAHNVFFPGRLG
ncbi:MAG: hypothetical protein GTN74_11340 [Proteobacteria bacterium]|nr:hypothetical protein [Pseudomonadota bacterium]NIS70840.1 hypothetical protein [Pseudomonadota bacterium]